MNKVFAAILMAVCLATQLARGDVWQDLAHYKYGDEKNAADQAAKLLQQTPVDQRGAIEDGLIAVVSAPDATPDGKAFACRMLQQVATEKSIPAWPRCSRMRCCPITPGWCWSGWAAQRPMLPCGGVG